MVDKVPRHGLATRSQNRAFWMPSGCFQIEAVDEFFRLHLGRVEQADSLSATNHQHVEFIDRDGCMALPAFRFLLQSVLHFLHRVGACVENFHVSKYLICVAEPTI